MTNGNGFIITEQTWEHMPDTQKSWILFETMQKVNTRLKALERWNKSFSFIGGLIGGAAAACGIRWIG